ncbi:MAG: penicillin acylase family protein [Gammaproteobacteria bacterium]|nr:penicillin acylase family protein [Gammaproteobacteria bacterium]
MRLRSPGRALWPASICLLLVAGCAGPATDERPGYTLTRDAWGVPQVVAASDEGIGRGVGFSVAEDHLCAAMDLIVTVNGERSLHFGAEERNSNGILNLHSDIAQRFLNDDEAVERWVAAQPARLVTRWSLWGHASRGSRAESHVTF